jgi:DNA-binding Lrp family transcriptional regulator
VIDLKEESVVFVRVSAGNLDNAIREIKRNKNVTGTEAILGPHDLVVTGAFKSFDTLRKFTEDLDTQDFCEESIAYPAYDEWEREGKEEHPWSAWTLVKTRDAEATKNELKRIGAVNKLYLTTGAYGLIARLSVENPEQLHETVLQELQKVEGVLRTETFPTIRTE